MRDTNGLFIARNATGLAFPSVARLGDEWLVVWLDGVMVRGARVSRDGVVSTPQTLAGPAIAFADSRTAVAGLGTNYLVSWVGYQNITNRGYAQEIRGTRISRDGLPLDTFTIFADTNVSVPGTGQVNFKAGYPAVTAGASDFLVTWECDYIWSNGWDHVWMSNLRGARVSSAGVVSPAFPVSVARQEQSHAKTAFNGSQFLVAWQDGRNAPVADEPTYDQHDIYGARVTDGGMIESNGLLISSVAFETPIVTWAHPVDITYGTPLSEAQLNATASVPGVFTYSPPLGTCLQAGSSQTLRVSFVPADLTRYTEASASVILNVLPAPLTIRADNKTKFHGQVNPPLTATCTGLVNGDTPTLWNDISFLTTPATPESLPGTYPIEVYDFDPANYIINPISGTLTVLPQRTQPGSVDLTFDANAGRVYAVVPLSDGRVLIGGWFTSVHGLPCNGIGRLHADGSLDSSFAPPSHAAHLR